ncbi:uncharacterized protein B0H18DRAFT_878903 [Fomitopsis serialis]|uniref:uncharacterized protein n=1 Tax=Fomitopsis serialis TaxID=139415 RepID=UPI0020076C89|nr:uncharacterized protein B0H18DRAFT_878903 [Neoantrodia serialis]KAH9923062.1 hypothetical protein B0H18DRAFT_878903 [Neoantrodia serialis]
MVHHATSKSSSTRSSPFRTEEERRHILSKLPQDAKILAIAPARLYQAPFGAREDGWAYTGLKGMLVFGRDRVVMHGDKPLGSGPGTSFDRRYWLRLVDTEPGKGVVWMHLIPTDFQYRLDKPFFHVFQGKSRMFGIRFDEDGHADRFYKKMSDHCTLHAVLPPRKISKAPSRSVPRNTSGTTSSSNAHRVRRSMISGPVPGTFDHVAHAGFTDGRLEASGKVEPEWKIMVEQMQRHGISLDGLQKHRVDGKMLVKNKDFVEGFLQGAQAVKRENSKSA